MSNCSDKDLPLPHAHARSEAGLTHPLPHDDICAVTCTAALRQHFLPLLASSERGLPVVVDDDDDPDCYFRRHRVRRDQDAIAGS